VGPWGSPGGRAVGLAAGAVPPLPVGTPWGVSARRPPPARRRVKVDGPLTDGGRGGAAKDMDGLSEGGVGKVAYKF
jgi:hypothetical protein